MDFVAIDVETANADRASICQIGIVKYENGVLAEEWKSYVDPEDHFDAINVRIHGIDESTVKGAPTLLGVSDRLHSFLKGSIVVCHTFFDRVALNKASQRYNVSLPECRWLDSARVARCTWAECASKGYGLYNVCAMLGYNFKHHDALEDAKAAAHILLAACSKTGSDTEHWIKRLSPPIDVAASRSGPTPKREGNPGGAFFGEVLVFTGRLEIRRREAADLAAAIGCRVATEVTKKTTMLVVGDQDIRILAGKEKTKKHKEAEDLIAKGTMIRILKESDFRELVRLSE